PSAPAPPAILRRPAAPGRAARPAVRATSTIELCSRKGDTAAHAPHRQGDACVSGTAERCRNARHDLVRQSRRFQRRCFLAAAPEDERIAALQPAYPFALPYEVDEHPVDGLLLHSGFADSLADRDELRFLAREIEYGFGYEPVIENYIRLAEKLLGAKREQPRVAGTRPHNVSFTLDRKSTR